MAGWYVFPRGRSVSQRTAMSMRSCSPHPNLSRFAGEGTLLAQLLEPSPLYREAGEG